MLSKPAILSADGDGRVQVGAPGVEACECFHSAWLDWEALRVALRLGPGELDGALWMRGEEKQERRGPCIQRMLFTCGRPGDRASCVVGGHWLVA